MDNDNDRRSCVIDIDNSDIEDDNKKKFINTDFARYIKAKLKFLLHYTINITCSNKNFEPVNLDKIES